MNKIPVIQFPGSHGWRYRCKECGEFLQDQPLLTLAHPTRCEMYWPIPVKINCQFAGQVFHRPYDMQMTLQPVEASK